MSHRDGSFEYPKHMFKLVGKKIIAIIRNFFLLNWPYEKIANSIDTAKQSYCGGSRRTNRLRFPA